MTTPLTLVATLVAKAGSEDELQQTLQDLQGASRAEADCIQYDFHKDAEQPRTFHMVEQWRDEAALTAHEATAFPGSAARHRTRRRKILRHENVPRLLRSSE